MRALTLIIALVTTPVFANVPSREMQGFQANGYRVLDAEYLAFVDDEPLRYPDDVMWGFYADDTTQEAQDCALRGYRQLRSFLEENPSEMRVARDAGVTTAVYLWVDDYSNASYDRSRRQARLWHWNPEGRDYARGYWKWEVVMTQGGNCILPERSQVLEALQRAADEMFFSSFK